MKGRTYEENKTVWAEFETNNFVKKFKKHLGQFTHLEKIA